MTRRIIEDAVTLLKRRAFSQYELEQKLVKQGYDEIAVNKAIRYVTERGYLNDTALCDRLLEKYAEMNKYSLKEIYVRLRQRGLAATLVHERLRNLDEEFEYRAAINFVKKYQKNFDGNIPKLVRRLAAKGFSSGTVSKVLKCLTDMSP